jgi:hypothetical protein
MVLAGAALRAVTISHFDEKTGLGRFLVLPPLY